MPGKDKPPLYAVSADRESRATKLIEEAAEMEALRFVEGFEAIRSRCESPIEELLMAALYAQHTLCEYRLDFMGGKNLPAEPYFDRAAFIYAQIPIGPYRADFVIHDATLPFDMAAPRVMIVECDGHDFHEKTKEQARRDKQRDRFLVSKGYKLLRFTGSEIWADPEKCADEIIDELAANDDWRNSQK